MQELLIDFLRQKPEQCISYFAYQNDGMQGTQELVFEKEKTGVCNDRRFKNGNQTVKIEPYTTWHIFYSRETDKAYAVGGRLDEKTELVIQGDEGYHNIKQILEQCTPFFGSKEFGAKGVIFTRDLYKSMPKILQNRIKDMIRQIGGFRGIWGYDSRAFTLSNNPTEYELDEWGSNGTRVCFANFIPHLDWIKDLSATAYLLPIAELPKTILVNYPGCKIRNKGHAINDAIQIINQSTTR